MNMQEKSRCILQLWVNVEISAFNYRKLFMLPVGIGVEFDEMVITVFWLIMEMSNFWKIHYFLIWVIVPACPQWWIRRDASLRCFYSFIGWSFLALLKQQIRDKTCSSLTTVTNEQIPSTDEDQVMRHFCRIPGKGHWSLTLLYVDSIWSIIISFWGGFRDLTIQH